MVLASLASPSTFRLFINRFYHMQLLLPLHWIFIKPQNWSHKKRSGWRKNNFNYPTRLLQLDVLHCFRIAFFRNLYLLVSFFVFLSRRRERKIMEDLFSWLAFCIPNGPAAKVKLTRWSTLLVKPSESPENHRQQFIRLEGKLLLHWLACRIHSVGSSLLSRLNFYATLSQQSRVA